MPRSLASRSVLTRAGLALLICAGVLVSSAPLSPAATIRRSGATLRYSGSTGVIATFRSSSIAVPSIEFSAQPDQQMLVAPETIVGCPLDVPEQPEISSVTCPMPGVRSVTLVVGRARGSGALASVDVLPVRTRVYGGARGDNLLVTDRPASERGPAWTQRRLVPSFYGGGGSDQLRLWARYTRRPTGRGLASGGPGNDRIAGSQIRDLLLGGTGNDAINARGGGRDVVDCGPGRDAVLKDRIDVARGCEFLNGLGPGLGIDITIRPGEVP
jgi:hypothetical protein